MRASVVFVLVTSLASAAHAQDAGEEARVEARARFTAGVEFAQQERWGEAAREFDAARELYDAPSIQLALGGALQRLGRYREAQRMLAPPRGRLERSRQSHAP